MLNNNAVYIEKSSGENVRIINEDLNFYELNNSVRIKKDIFEKKYEKQVEVDPNEFFQKQAAEPFMDMFNKIKNYNTNNIVENNLSNQTYINNNTETSNNEIHEARISNEEKERILRENREFLLKNQPKEIQEKYNKDINNDYIDNESNIDIKDNIYEEKNSIVTINKTNEKNIVNKVDPVSMMFKMFKNNYSVKLNIEIEENIPNPQFISIIQENVDTDAIEYYSKIISDKLLNNPDKIKIDIYNQLKEIINNDLNNVPKEHKEPKEPKDTNKTSKLNNKK